MPDKFKSAVLISVLVTSLAAQHYFGIFDSWVEAYWHSPDKDSTELKGIPVYDAYRYKD